MVLYKPIVLWRNAIICRLHYNVSKPRNRFALILNRRCRRRCTNNKWREIQSVGNLDEKVNSLFPQRFICIPEVFYKNYDQFSIYRTTSANLTTFTHYLGLSWNWTLGTQSRQKSFILLRADELYMERKKTFRNEIVKKPIRQTQSLNGTV